MLYRVAEEIIKETKKQKIIAYRPDLPMVPCPCPCGAESFANPCEGDGRLHYHGRVHTIGGKLLALCKKCARIDAKKWQEKRAGK